MRDLAVVVNDLSEVPATERADVAALVSRADAADDHPPLPEPERLALADPSRSPGTRLVRALGPEGTLLGGALVSRARDGSSVVHFAVDPPARRGPEDVTAALVAAASADVPAERALHAWVMQAGDGADARLAALGLVPERDLLQLRVGLPLRPEVVAATRPLATRPFVPGRDEQAWLESNNRAFAAHPEQGGWTLSQLRARLAAPWVDLEGFLVADDPEGPGLIGSCWTKIHADRDPVLGEIYVIAVDPHHHGQGWGRSLTVAGLGWLAGRGVRHGMLYVDADNRAAVHLYRSLGFVVHHVDRAYVRLR